MVKQEIHLFHAVQYAVSYDFNDRLLRSVVLVI